MMPRSLARAGVAQLVEYELPKLGVAGSNPVARSNLRSEPSVVNGSERVGIFGKSETKPAENTAKPVAPAPVPPAVQVSRPPAADPAATTSSVIGPRAIVKGDLLGDDDVLVQGSLEGVVTISRELRVAEGGRVNASVQAASIVVSGEIVGNCVATQRIEIQSTGRVVGDIRAPRITIAEGAGFKGKSEMGRAAEKAHGSATPPPD